MRPTETDAGPAYICPNAEAEHGPDGPKSQPYAPHPGAYTYTPEEAAASLTWTFEQP